LSKPNVEGKNTDKIPHSSHHAREVTKYYRAPIMQIKETKTTGYPPRKIKLKIPQETNHVNHTHAMYVINSMTYLSQEVIFADVRLWQTSHDVNKTLNYFLLGIDHSKVKSTVGRHGTR